MFFPCLNKLFPLLSLNHGKNFSMPAPAAGAGTALLSEGVLKAQWGTRAGQGIQPCPRGLSQGRGLLLVPRQRGQPGDSPQRQPLSTVPWAGKAPL